MSEEMRFRYCRHCGSEVVPYGDDERHDLWCDKCAIGFVRPEIADAELIAESTELTTLRAEVRELREALEAIIKCEDESETGMLHDEYGLGPNSDTFCSDHLEMAMQTARAALAKGEK